MTIDWAATGAMLQGEGAWLGAAALFGAAVHRLPSSHERKYSSPLLPAKAPLRCLLRRGRTFGRTGAPSFRFPEQRRLARR